MIVIYRGGGSRIPHRSGRQPSGGCPDTKLPKYEIAKFSEKLHEIEKISGRRGALNPPLIYVTLNEKINNILKKKTNNLKQSPSTLNHNYYFVAEIEYCGIDGECQNGGMCYAHISPGGHCECPAGWYGDLCQCKFFLRLFQKNLQEIFHFVRPLIPLF